MMKRIPLIKADLPSLNEVQSQFGEILESGKITNFGKHVTEFEAKSSEYLGTYTVTTSSATVGLILVLQALGVRQGSKVAIPSFSFVATAQAVCYAGAVPVFVDIADDLNISVEDLATVLAEHSDVWGVVPVHMYGLPCRAQKIRELAEIAGKQRGRPVPVVYDAAHAFGSAHDGVRVGGSGDAEVFSLSVTKIMTSVEGGMISSRNKELIQRLRKMRNYGIEENYNAHWPGLNGKMSEFHAIIGIENLKRLPELLARRKLNANYYTSAVLSRTSFKVAPAPDNVVHTFKDFTVMAPSELKSKRDLIMSYLGEKGIETRAYFHPPIHEQLFFARFSDRPLPVTEDLSRRVITLPFYTSITQEEMDYVVDSLAEAEKI